MESKIAPAVTVPRPEDIVRIIVSNPIVITNEKAVQEDISRLLDGAGIRHKREVRLSDGNVVDFMIEGGIAVEVKLKAAKREIFRQCERYCRHSQVNALVLVSGTPIGLPADICGKPCWLASMGAAWL